MTASKPPPDPRMKETPASVSKGTVQTRQSAVDTLEGRVTGSLTGSSSKPPPSSSGPPSRSPLVREAEERAARAARVLRKVFLWWRRIAIASLVVGVISAIGLVIVVRRIEAGLPKVSDLRGNYHPPQVTRILARDGTLLAELFTERRTVVGIETLPAHVKLAVLAAEDAGFYEHEGLNYWGILRAFGTNLKSGHLRQGGSSITQQVVKNLLLDPERTLKRKIREALLARRIEQELSKDEILELYMNHIYFGHGRYGIEEAARDSFGKPAKDLTIAEAAMIAGTIACPETCSPKKDIKKALTRRAFVLGQMHDKGFLNDAQHDAAKDETVRLASSIEPSADLAPEVVEIARKALKELDPARANRGGFTITTTIDPRLQAAARKALRDDLQAYDKRHSVQGPLKPPIVADRKGRPIKVAAKDAPFDGTPSFETHKVYVGVVTATDDATGAIDVRVGSAFGSFKIADAERYNPQKVAPSAFAPVGTNLRVSLLAPVPEGAGTLAKTPLRLESGPEGALVAIDPRTRQVLALVGSYEAVTGGLDRSTQAHRQPGSTFKPVLYSYALHARRYTPASLVDVTPGSFAGGYKPSNYEGWTATDPLRLREVLANSVNIGAVRVLDDVGPGNVVEWGHALGIKSVLKPDLSLALGSYEVTPIELAGAYATFDAGGTYEEPRLITKIVGPDNRELELRPPPPPHRVLDDAEAYLITNMMTSVIDHGTGARAQELRRPAAGKTGTSNQSKDTWFAGFTTEVVAVVWVGYDDGKPLGNAESGAQTALPAWISFMKAAHDHKPASEFPRPAGIVTVKIDKRTGKLPFDGDTDTMDEVFLAGTEPTETGGPQADATPHE